jgi:hypothetical protein
MEPTRASIPPALVAQLWATASGVGPGESGQGVTALCPRCGIDSVIGSDSGFPVERGFLRRMKQHWMRTEKKSERP